MTFDSSKSTNNITLPPKKLPPTPPPRGSPLSQSAGPNSPVFSNSNNTTPTPSSPSSPSLNYYGGNQQPGQYATTQSQTQPQPGQYGQYQQPQQQQPYYPYPPPPPPQQQQQQQYQQQYQQPQQIYYPYPPQQYQQPYGQHYQQPQQQFNPYGQPSPQSYPGLEKGSNGNTSPSSSTSSFTPPSPQLSKMSNPPEQSFVIAPPQQQQLQPVMMQPPMVSSNDIYQQVPINQPIIQYVQNIGSSATFDIYSPPVTIENGRFIPPSGVKFIQGHKLQVRIISAQNLISADLNGLSDPYCVLKSECLNVKATKTIEKNLNPHWNETMVVQIDKPDKDCLIIEVYDQDLIGEDDFLGYCSIDLSLLPFGIPIKTIEKLSYAKHGTIEIELTALDFGVTNIPMNYNVTYSMWRNDHIKSLTRKGFKEVKKEAKKTKKDSGPYYGKVTNHGYKFYYGYIKRRRSKGEVAEDVGKTTLKVVGYTIAYTLLLPVMVIASG